MPVAAPNMSDVQFTNAAVLAEHWRDYRTFLRIIRYALAAVAITLILLAYFLL